MMPTHPPNVGNRARILQLCAALKSLGHDLHFAYVRREAGDMRAMEEFHGKDRLHVAHYTPTGREAGVGQRLKRRVLAAFSVDAAFTHRVDDWYDPELDGFFEQLNATHAFDAVIVEYVFLSRALQFFRSGAVKVIDTHDVFTNRHHVSLAAGLWPGWFSTTLAEELRGLRRADVVFTIQDRERDFFAARLRSQEVVTVGHLLRTGAPIVDWNDRIARSLLFVGTDNVLNAAAVRYFLERVLPIVRASIPDVRLRLAGSVADAVDAADGVDKIGVVDDLEREYANAWVALNPCQAGTGLAIKSIEALGYALPLVTTTTGARGLEAFGRDAFVEVPDHDPQRMAEAIVELMLSEERRARISAAAAEFSSRWNAGALAVLKNTFG